MDYKKLINRRISDIEIQIDSLFDIIHQTEIRKDLTDNPSQKELYRLEIIKHKKSIKDAEIAYKNLEKALNDRTIDISDILTIQDKTEKFSRETNLYIRDFPLSKVENFTGRIEEKKELIKNLKEKNICHVRSYIFGMGGIGKTALAIETIQEISDKNYFKDGIIWYRVIDEDINRILFRFSNIITNASGKPNPLVKSPKNEYIKNFKRNFSSYEILFVIDNADYDLHNIVIPLLDALEGFSLLLTSRQELPLPANAHIINLGTLNEDDCINLFTHILGESHRILYDNESQINELCEKLGYLPLAVKLSAYYIKNQYCTLSTYLIKWNNGQEKLKLLEADTLDSEISRRNVSICFELSLKSLKDLEISLFLWLGLFPTSFNFEDLSQTLIKSSDNYLSKMDINTTRDTILLLKKLSLIDKLEGSDTSLRIYLHPLLQEFAIGKRSGDIDKDKRIILEHYLSKLEETVDILYTEYGIINEAIEWLFNNALHSTLIELTIKIGPKLFDKGFWKFNKKLLELAISSAQFIDNKNDIAILQAKKAYLESYSQGNNLELKIIEDATSYFEKNILYIKDDSDYSQVLNNIDTSLLSTYIHCKYILTIQKDIDINLFMQGLNFALNNNVGIPHFIHLLSKLYIKKGNLSDAKILHENMAEYWGNNKSFHNEVLHRVEAISLIPNKEEYLVEIDNFLTKNMLISIEEKEIVSYISFILPMLIYFKLYQDDIPSAKKSLLVLEKYSKQFDSPSIWSRYYVASSRIYRYTGMYSESIKDLLQAHQLSSVSEIDIAYAYLINNDIKNVLKFLKKYEKSDNKNYLDNSLYYATLIYLNNFLKINKNKNKFYKNKLQDSIFEYGYEKFILNYPVMNDIVQNLTIKKNENNALSKTIYINNLCDKQYVWCNKSSFNKNEFKLSLEIDNMFLSVKELFKICKDYNITLPTYYTNSNYKYNSHEIARFISGKKIFEIIHKTGLLIPNLSLLSSISTNSDFIIKDIVHSSEDWENIIQKALKWFNFDINYFSSRQKK